MFSKARFLISVVLVLSVFAIESPACKVPVFRYALERWAADRFTIVAVIDGEPNDVVADALGKLQSLRDSQANVDVEIIDLSTLSEAELWSVEGLGDTEEAPVLQVFYPDQDSGQRRLCWSGELTAENVEAWRDSPLRRKICEEIQSGVSAIWLFVEGNDSEANADSVARLMAALRQAESTVEIPEGVIRRRDAAVVLAEDATLSMDDVLRCDIPLKVQFSLIVLSRDDDQEWALRAMVEGMSNQTDVACAVPIFGRGRMIDPLPMSSFKDQSVLKACSYLFGECSCSVKALNPGTDLLLDASWQDLLGDQVVISEAVVVQPESLSIPPGHVQNSRPDFDQATPVEDNFAVSGLLVAIVALGCLIAAVFAWSRVSTVAISSDKHD
ncbi:MAG: hypothetical protein AAFX06_07295 [Planctomycetota bacterium]